MFDQSKWHCDCLNVWKVGAILPKTHMAQALEPRNRFSSQKLRITNKIKTCDNHKKRFQVIFDSN